MWLPVLILFLPRFVRSRNRPNAASRSDCAGTDGLGAMALTSPDLTVHRWPPLAPERVGGGRHLRSRRRTRGRSAGVWRAVGAAVVITSSVLMLVAAGFLL